MTAAATTEDQATGAVARYLRPLLVPLLSLATALVVGGVLIFLTDTEGGLSGTIDALQALFSFPLGSQRGFSETLVAMVPLSLAGLSVAFAFQAGLFNIGATGQLVFGTIAASWVGFTLELPSLLHVPLALVAGFLGGAFWGAIVGVLKARSGAHEVITTIMLNFVALAFVQWVLTTTTFQREGRSDPISKQVLPSAELWELRVGDLRLNASLLLVIGCAVAVWWVLERSTVGFQLMAVGSNASAATYAGMSVGATWIVAMAVSGGLAGLGGAGNLLGNQVSFSSVFPAYGFDAIALALLGRAKPAGVIAAAGLFAVLQVGARGMSAQTGTPTDIVVVVQGLIIALVAAPVLIRAMFRLKDTGEQNLSFSAGWGG